ncbi:hypothetical protein [Chryseobacterium sp. MMS23-Vi53]|uniref:hypothetical protein n=1 Tax=Chryseobacterium sp. MMS23-Vi53 TaxID=3386644 RepID=UPI0039EB1D38
MKLKKLYSLITIVGGSCFAFAQVGINTTTPQASLDVIGNVGDISTKDGIMAPRISKQQLAAKSAGTYGTGQTGALVYVSDVTPPTGVTPSLVQVSDITANGYYFFNGIQWKNVNDSAVNIYNSNGTLSGIRTVATGGNTLTFNNASNSSVTVATSATEGRLVATGSNRGSIGLTSGTSLLNVFQDTGSLGQIVTSGASTGLNVATNNATPISLLTNGATRMTVASGGNVGIGTTAPSNALHVNATDPLRLQGLTAGVTSTDPLMVVDATGVVKTIGTLSSLSIPNPAVFRLETAQTDFLSSQGIGGSQVVPMSVVKNTIPGLSYNSGTSTITFPAGTYQLTFVYEGTHNQTSCTLSSYFVDFPLNAGSARIHNTAAHNLGSTSNHGGTITYATTVPANRTWTIALGRGQSGNCSGTGMLLFAGSTQLLVFRIGD